MPGYSWFRKNMALLFCLFRYLFCYLFDYVFNGLGIAVIGVVKVVLVHHHHHRHRHYLYHYYHQFILHFKDFSVETNLTHLSVIFFTPCNKEYKRYKTDKKTKERKEKKREERKRKKKRKEKKKREAKNVLTQRATPAVMTSIAACFSTRVTVAGEQRVVRECFIDFVIDVVFVVGFTCFYCIYLSFVVCVYIFSSVPYNYHHHYQIYYFLSINIIFIYPCVEKC